jgi:hypothetical protein
MKIQPAQKECNARMAGWEPAICFCHSRSGSFFLSQWIFRARSTAARFTRASVLCSLSSYYPMQYSSSSPWDLFCDEGELVKIPMNVLWREEARLRAVIRRRASDATARRDNIDTVDVPSVARVSLRKR